MRIQMESAHNTLIAIDLHTKAPGRNLVVRPLPPVVYDGAQLCAGGMQGAFRDNAIGRTARQQLRKCLDTHHHRLTLMV